MKSFILHLVTLFILSAVLFSTAHKSWIRLSYEVNKLEIIEKFCINKEETKFQCDGKCHLKTELDKADKKTEDAPKESRVENQITLYQVSFEKIKVEEPLVSSESNFHYQNLYSFLKETSIDPPPRFV